MFFSFLTRWMSSTSEHPFANESEDHLALQAFVDREEGILFQNFKLFHRDKISTIDVLLFLPNFGLYLGETLSWSATELEKATLERSSKQNKRPASTHLGDMEAKVRSKLQDVLSFDFTPIQRFIWMKNLSESEFDKLDPSFHTLLPKSHLLFREESLEAIQTKLHSLGEFQEQPLSPLKIIGALNSHAFMLPTPMKPQGALLSLEQNTFLHAPLTETTLLLGDYGSGKSTLLIRKAMLMLLSNPEERILIITPTLLASELLRNDFVSLMYYGALSIDLARISFTFMHPALETLKSFTEATAIFCDDSYLMDIEKIHRLTQKQEKYLLLLSSIHEIDISATIVHLSHNHRGTVHPENIICLYDELIPALLSELRKRLIDSASNDIAIVCSDMYLIPPFKEAIEEYINCNCRILTQDFSLQSQDLDDILLTTEDFISGISTSHVILVTSNDLQDYSYPLSRASETATIISYENPKGEIDGSNN